MKVGIVGAGQIVPSFLAAAALNSKIEIKAICAVAMLDRLKTLQRQYAIDEIFEDVDEMLKIADVDTIYIAVPNHLHALMAKKALAKGKHVILEKPFTITLKEAEDLFALARKQHRFLFEAITTIHSPNYKKAKSLVSEMETVKIVYLNYTQYSSRYDAFMAGQILPAFDSRKAGGALRDINIYNIHFVVGMFGLPDAVKYYPNIVHHVDVSGTLIMEYKNFTCTLIGAKDCSNHAEIRIQGDKKTLVSSSPANVFAEFDFIRDQEIEHVQLLENKERLYAELKEFERVIRERDVTAMEAYQRHTLDVMKVIDMLGSGKENKHA